MNNAKIPPLNFIFFLYNSSRKEIYYLHRCHDTSLFTFRKVSGIHTEGGGEGEAVEAHHHGLGKSMVFRGCCPLRHEKKK